MICTIGKSHRPKYSRTVQHHKIPVSWGGQHTPTNMVELCDNHHYAIHVAIDQMITGSGDVPDRRLFGHETLLLAQYAWENRPNDNPPRTLKDMH